MILEAAAVGFFVGDYVYHRWFDDKLLEAHPKQEITLPITEDGAPIPMIFGRVRCRSPILAWNATPVLSAGIYEMNMMLVLGLGMQDSTNLVHNIWAGEKKLGWIDQSPLITGDAGEFPIVAEGNTRDGSGHGGFLEFLNGKSTQIVADDSDTYLSATTNAAAYMLTPAADPGGGGLTVAQIPSYRGYLSCFLFGGAGGQWKFGPSPTVPAYSVEASSYNTGHARLGTYARVGDDLNPINAIFDLIVAKHGKAGIPEDYIDVTNFQAAQYTLMTESHRYSRFVDGSKSLGEHIIEVLKQIDATLYEDEATGKWKIKLIRNDFDPTTIPVINKNNCKDIVNFSMGGRTNIINRVRLRYTSREREYVEDSEVASNTANAVGEDGRVNELVLEMLGVTTQLQAVQMAYRELDFRSRPVMKCRALVDRSLIRLNPGDPVKLVWTSPDIAGVVMRVARKDRGTLESGVLGLDLIQDAFYTHRDRTPRISPIPRYRDPRL